MPHNISGPRPERDHRRLKTLDCGVVHPKTIFFMKRVTSAACATVAVAITLAFPLGAADDKISVLERGKPVEATPVRRRIPDVSNHASTAGELRGADRGTARD